MKETQRLDVVITIDVGKNMSVKEFVDVFAEEIVMANPVPFETINKVLKLDERKFYVRAKHMPEAKLGSDIIAVPAKLEIGC